MPAYGLIAIFGIAAAMFEVIGHLIENKTVCRVLSCINAILGILSIILNIMVNQEVYTTNGSSIMNNEVYFELGDPFSVYYTFTPYADPKKDGQKYMGSFAIKESETMRYVTCLGGIIWGEIKSQEFALEESAEQESSLNVLKDITWERGMVHG